MYLGRLSSRNLSVTVDGDPDANSLTGKALSGRVCSSGGLAGARDATKAGFSVCPLIFLNI